MLQKMCKAVLAVLLITTSGAYHQTTVSHLARQVLMHDAKAIAECEDDGVVFLHLRVQR